MTIQIGGHSFTEEQVIAAIQASDNQTVVASPYQNLDELGGIMQAVLHRLTALETDSLRHTQGSVLQRLSRWNRHASRSDARPSRQNCNRHF